MNWKMVEIEDRRGQVLTGADAMDFVLEKITGRVIVQAFQSDNFALRKDGKSFVAPDDVYRILTEGLAGNFKTIRVVGASTVPKTSFVPNPVISNPINIVPVYSIEFRIGEIDALFDPITQTGEPWKDRGVKQRLQVLGYLYTPLDHPGNNAGLEFKHSKACWEYFKKVHHGATDSAAIDLLKNEVEGNLIASKLPVSGEILAESTLPLNGAFGAIRFPGGYGGTRSPVTNLNAGDHLFNNGIDSNVNAGVDPKYNFGAGDRRSDIENVVAQENALLGIFPLIARVTATWPGDKKTYPADVPVIFQLIPPDDVTDPVTGDKKFAPEPLPDKVMNYKVEGMHWRFPIYPKELAVNLGLTEEEWLAIHMLTTAATVATPATPAATAHSSIDLWAPMIAVPQSVVSSWWPGPAAPPRLLTPLEYVEKQIGFLYSKINPAAANPIPKPINVTRLSADEWNGVYKLVAAAKSRNPADDAAGKQEATNSLRAWANAPAVNWAQIQAWWPDQTKVPYPKLRSNMVDKAKLAADYLLTKKAEADNVLPEILNAGQKKYIDDLLTATSSAAGAADPQKRNAPNATYGGKLGLGIDQIFDKSGTSFAGFHTKRPGQKYDFGDIKQSALPADTGKNPHAMRCDTNDTGFAGVLFKPSRCGGDAYKLRAYIDPDWLETKAKGPNHASVIDSGTLVVWRNIRFHRYLQKKNLRQPFGPDLSETMRRAENSPGTKQYDDMFLNTDVTDLLLLPGTANEGAAYTGHNVSTFLSDSAIATKVRYRPLPVTPNSLKKQLSWGYCELIADSSAIEVLDLQKQRDGIAAGVRAFSSYFDRIKAVSWPHLLFEDPASPFMLNIRSCRHYNEIIQAAGLTASFPPLGLADKAALGIAMHRLFDAMMEHYSGAVLPGLTVVQFPRWSTWDFRVIGINVYEEGVKEGFDPPVTSGYGPPVRGAYVSHTYGVYNNLHCYPATSNAIHELGHNLGFAHQVPAGGDIEAAHQKSPFTRTPGQAEAFVQPTADECVCVMSYSGCYGDLCGMCIMSLRGWAQSHTNTTAG